MKKGYPQEEGPFIRRLDETLKEFDVARQAYYGGTFVGNHLHRSLQVTHTNTIGVVKIYLLVDFRHKTSGACALHPLFKPNNTSPT